MLVLGLVGGGGCTGLLGGDAVVAHDRRVWEMEDHAADLFAARDALREGDLRGVEDAGLRLAAPDPLPGLPDDAVVSLEAVRAGGRLVATAGDRASAAELLVTVTLSCAACHRQMGIVRPVPPDLPAEDRRWLSLVFEDDGAWPEPGPASWRERRAAVSASLAGK